MRWWWQKEPISARIVVRHFGDDLIVFIYDDIRHLHKKMAERMAYKKRRGYYWHMFNKHGSKIHCINDEWVLGHEMLHAMGIIGEGE